MKPPQGSMLILMVSLLRRAINKGFQRHLASLPC